MSIESVPRMGKSIKLTDEVHKALQELGTKSETFSDIVKRLIESYKKTHSKK